MDVSWAFQKFSELVFELFWFSRTSFKISTHVRPSLELFLDSLILFSEALGFDNCFEASRFDNFSELQSIEHWTFCVCLVFPDLFQSFLRSNKAFLVHLRTSRACVVCIVAFRTFLVYSEDQCTLRFLVLQIFLGLPTYIILSFPKLSKNLKPKRHKKAFLKVIFCLEDPINFRDIHSPEVILLWQIWSELFWSLFIYCSILEDTFFFVKFFWTILKLVELQTALAFTKYLWRILWPLKKL